jgi:hypothetical protein
MSGGGNVLTVTSTGNVEDDTTLHVNDVEIVTGATLKAYVNGILTDTGFGFTSEVTETFKFAGVGTRSAPLEANPSIPPASETSFGIVKVVNEGSHGFPCPGYGGTNFYGWYLGNGQYAVLRNGADDLEEDVFINKVSDNPYKYTPTADRFRPSRLPITAKPTKIRHGTEDCVWLDTTDGPFILLTNRNPDHNTWRCLKVTNTDMELGYYGCPFVHNGKLYVVMSTMLPSGSVIRMWEATIPASGTTVTFTARTLTGNNHNGTPQNSTSFKQFDKMIGAIGEKAYVVSDGYYTTISISHAGDQYDHVQKGNLVRFCHNGWFWAGNTVGSMSAWRSASYQLDLLTGVVTVDNGNFPGVITRGQVTGTNPRNPLMCSGGNLTVNAVRANSKILTFQSYGRLYNPQLSLLNNNGNDNFENARWDRQDYAREGASGFLGSYAGPVHSGIRGSFPLSGNRMIGVCLDGFRVQFKYDPNGSYSPTAKGYGPTNDRVQLFSNDLHDSLARMTWYFNGDVTKQAGTSLQDNKLSNYTTYENDERGTQTSIDANTFATIKQQAVSKFASNLIPTITESRLTLGIHRAPNVPMLAMLQVIWTVPTDPNGRKQAECFVFEIRPGGTVGVIGSVVIGKLIASWTQNATATGFYNWDNYYFSNSGVHRLNDGGHVVMLGGQGVLWVGNGGSPSIAAVYNSSGEFVDKLITSVNTVTGESWVGTKELGFGLTWISDSGEGLYLRSYGKTVPEIVQTIGGTRPHELYILVLSRSDAGDNVAISQYAANDVKVKIESLVPPARKVQGMTLTEDRVVTKAMLANANKIPNQRDATYPVQQAHIDSLQSMALKTHTHPAGDFLLEQATTAAYGAAKLGSLISPDTDAFSAAEIDSLEDIVDVLHARTVSLNQMDATLTIDYEV